MFCPFCGVVLTPFKEFRICSSHNGCGNFIESDDLSFEEICDSLPPDTDVDDEIPY